MKISFYNKFIFSAIILVIMTISLFHQTLNNNFINLDDTAYIYRNVMLQDISLKSIYKIFTSVHRFAYKPLVILSCSIEFTFFKLDPFIYHLTNLIFHCLNTLLVFYFVYLITPNFTISILTSLFFSIHPMHVESVAWATERKDMLYAFFYLAALCFYLKFKIQKKYIYYFFCFISIVLSMLSKPQGLTFPVVLLLIDYYKNQKLTAENFYNKIPFFVISIFFTTLGIYLQLKDNNNGTIKSVEPLTAFFYGCYNIFFYLEKLFIPLKLSILYPAPLDDIKFLSPLFFLYISMIPLFAFLFFFIKWPGKKIGLFGFLFFFIIILPTLHIIPVGEVITADRYSYLSYIGLFYVLFSFFEFIAVKLKSNNLYRIILYLVLIEVVVVFFSISFRRTIVWRNSMTLMNDALKKYPNQPLAYFCRGYAFHSKKFFVEAVRDYNAALLYKVDYKMIYNFRAAAFLSMKMYPEAQSDLYKALELKADYQVALANLGLLYFCQGKYQKALDRVYNLLPAANNYLLINLYRGYCFSSIGKYEDAIKEFEFCKKNNIADRTLFYFSGLSKYNLNDFSGAAADFEAYADFENIKFKYFLFDGIQPDIESLLDKNKLYIAAAETYFKLKKTTKSLEYLQKISDVSDSSVITKRDEILKKIK